MFFWEHNYSWICSEDLLDFILDYSKNFPWIYDSSISRNITLHTITCSQVVYNHRERARERRPLGSAQSRPVYIRPLPPPTQVHCVLFRVFASIYPGQFPVCVCSNIHIDCQYLPPCWVSNSSAGYRNPGCSPCPELSVMDFNTICRVSLCFPYTVDIWEN